MLLLCCWQSSLSKCGVDAQEHACASMRMLQLSLLRSMCLDPSGMKTYVKAAFRGSTSHPSDRLLHRSLKIGRSTFTLIRSSSVHLSWVIASNFSVVPLEQSCALLNAANLSSSIVSFNSSACLCSVRNPWPESRKCIVHNRAWWGSLQRLACPVRELTKSFTAERMAKRCVLITGCSSGEWF